MSAKRTLVTGAAGFIGSRVVRRLLARGHTVRAAIRPGESRRNLTGLNVEIVEADVTDKEAMKRSMQGIEWLFHLAAVYALWLPDLSVMSRVNVGGTRIVLAAARDAGVERVVYTSSIARFGGQGPGRRGDESSAFALGPTGNFYAETKARSHEIALDAAKNGQDIVIVAPTGPIGPGDAGPTPTGKLLLWAFAAPALVAIPTVTNFGHVDDIAEGHVLAAERGKTGESYLLGGQDLSVAELVGLVAKVTGKRKPVVDVPYPVAEVAARAALFATRWTKKAPLFTPDSVEIAKLGLAADCSKAVRELGLPQTPIERAVADAYEWFSREGYLSPR